MKKGGMQPSLQIPLFAFILEVNWAKLYLLMNFLLGAVVKPELGSRNLKDGRFPARFPQQSLFGPKFGSATRTSTSNKGVKAGQEVWNTGIVKRVNILHLVISTSWLTKVLDKHFCLISAQDDTLMYCQFVETETWMIVETFNFEPLMSSLRWHQEKLLKPTWSSSWNVSQICWIYFTCSF